MINVVLVHHLSIVADLKTDDDIREEAFAACDEAINYFEKVILFKTINFSFVFRSI